MAKKILRRTARRINKEDKEDKLGLVEKNTEIFNTNREIISKSIEMSSMGMIDIDPELLKTGMLAS
ncbi:MAG: hypothetical protein CVT88_04160 [Candidatus Altiarchaeales archaeon HGW-Altiarchaeales-1]|nr:MAG: hypothetical protein CVT88_04160 [Candidatus Altiarchaeales archaeon HGW-Altiarchaeales-1]